MTINEVKAALESLRAESNLLDLALALADLFRESGFVDEAALIEKAANL